MAISILVVAAFLLAAYLYRSLPQIVAALSMKRAALSPRHRAARSASAKAELESYRAALEDPGAFQAQALHGIALIAVSGIMTVLMVALFAVSQLVQMRWAEAPSIPFATVDALLVLFALSSLVGFRLAVFRSWMFLHPQRNLGRLERTVTRLEAK